jgi:hypothetical protein
MGDFGEGIDQSNSMLGEMKQYNSRIKEHAEERSQFLTEQLGRAKAEKSAVSTPTALGEDVSQVAQIGAKAKAAREVFGSTYGSDLGAYAKGLGRTGEETDLGLSKAVSVAKKVSSLAKSSLPSGFTPRPLEGPLDRSALEGATETIAERTARGGAAGADSVAGKPIRAVPDLQQEITTRPLPPSEPIPVKQVRPSGGEPQAPPTAEAGAAGGEEEAVSLAGKTAKVAGSVGELAGAAGVGLGILGGGASLAADMAGGHFHLSGDNTAEKAGNALSMAGGALDTMSMVAPPLAILGGILGLASAISEGIGHLEHSAKTTSAAETEAKAPPKETAMGVTSLAAVGQVASQGSDMLHTITGTTAF